MGLFVFLMFNASRFTIKNLRYALCAMLFALGDGAGSVGRMCVEPYGQARRSILNACVGRNPDQDLVAFCCRGKLWLEERTPEELKGEGG